MGTTARRDWSKFLTTNDTTNGYASRVATTTEPVDAGVKSLDAGGDQNWTTLEVLLFGAGADNATLGARILGWRKISTLWVPTILADLSGTLSTSVGVASAAVLNTDRFVDTVTINGGINVATGYAAQNQPLVIQLDVSGYSKVELITTTGGSATNVNALYAAF